MRFINSAIFLVAVLIFSSFPAFAQETEAVVVDEVVAQVNDGVITLSRIKREIKQTIDAVVAEGKKTKEEAKADSASPKMGARKMSPSRWDKDGAETKNCLSDPRDRYHPSTSKRRETKYLPCSSLAAISFPAALVRCSV